jgi:hypothetical protein
MRKPNSNFNLICKFLNTIDDGEEFTTAQLRASNRLLKKNNRHGFTYECMHQNLGMIHTAGFISRVSHGRYKLIYPIPDQLTRTDLDIHRGYTEMFVGSVGEHLPRKQNPFDIKAYFREYDKQKSYVKPSSKELDSNITLVYKVDMQTGKIIDVPIMNGDNSWKSLAFTFDDREVAESFAEGWTGKPNRIEQEQDIIDFSAVENNIAETLFNESQDEPNLNNQREEVSIPSPSEVLEKFEDIRKDEISSNVIDTILSVDQQVYIVDFLSSSKEGLSIKKDIIHKIQVEIAKCGTRIYYSTLEGHMCCSDEIDDKIFTDKSKAAAKLLSLI